MGTDPAAGWLVRTIEAPAKINLWLHVLDRHPDGYHELDTVMQTLELADTVTVNCRPGRFLPDCCLSVTGPVAVPPGPNNLCVQAARAYLERWPAPMEITITLDKRVPVAAGLGGGSSDAAAVLLALRHLLGPPEDLRLMVPTARALGADVAFFLVRGTARGRGRGDLIEPLPDLLPSPVWLVVPPVAVPTERVFASYAADRQSESSLQREVVELPESASLEAWIRGNDLEDVARALFPELNHIYTVLNRFGFAEVQLSGSGGVVFGIPPDGADRRTVAQALGRAGEILVTETRPRGALGSDSGP
jgi:4-diphosphocytidyl-2-C-methyl-D-erythritol kinase